MRTTYQAAPHTKRMPSGNWKVWYRDLDGRQKTKTFPDSEGWTKAELKRAIATLLDPVNNVRASALHKDALQSVWETWLARIGPHMKPTTRRTYTSIVKVVDRYGLLDQRVGRITRADVQELLLRMRDDGYAPNTLWRARTVLSTLFRYAIDAGLRDEANPATGRFKGFRRCNVRETYALVKMERPTRVRKHRGLR